MAKHADPVDQPGDEHRVVKLFILGILVAVLAGVIYDKGIHDHLIARNFGVVEPGEIYRSGRLTPAATRRVVENNDIKTIIDLGAYELGSPEELVASRTAEALGVTRYRMFLEGDGTGNPNVYVAALRILRDPANHPVLVHCAAGAQRTSGCIMLYRNFEQGVPFLDSYSESFGHGHDPSDNPRLPAYLIDHADEIEAALASGGWIEGFEIPPGFDEVSGAVEP